MKRLGILGCAAMMLGSMTASTHAQEGDVAKGEQVFKRCMACHQVGENAANKIGPILNNVIGRQAGTIEGFRYSDLNKHAGENGLVWNEERIFNYLENPNDFLKKLLTDAGKADLAKGTTRMAFRLAKQQERRDVVAYLKQFSDAASQ
jgi:cytochrome c